MYASSLSDFQSYDCFIIIILCQLLFVLPVYLYIIVKRNVFHQKKLFEAVKGNLK